MKINIGIGITTRNRPEVLEQCLSNILRYYPNESKYKTTIVVIDDASTPPCEKATFRFEKNVGIAKAKNKCLELLEAAGCEHFFLFDDDCYPINKDWCEPYIKSKEHHLMYIYEDYNKRNPKMKITKTVFKSDDLIGYSHPRGCMLYCDKLVLDTVGGMDSTFSGWGFEHGDWTNRIHAAGLTFCRFGHIPNSSGLIYSKDEHREVASSVTQEDKLTLMNKNKNIHDERWNKAEYCEYKEGRNIVITPYLTSKIDNQRKKKWEPKRIDILALMNSLKGIETILFTDELDIREATKITPIWNPYFQRWLSAYTYLEENPDVNFVWIVDATDVELLHNPFPHMKKGIVYCGSEKGFVGSSWMVQNHSFLKNWINENRGKPLMNAGLLGGDRKTIMAFLKDLIEVYMESMIRKDELLLDMAPFNYVAHSGKFEIITGPMVHSKFKAYEHTSSAWWRHK